MNRIKKIICVTAFFVAAITNAQVGIGTQTPTETLDVAGTVRVREVQKMEMADFMVSDSIMVMSANGVIKRVPSMNVVMQAANSGAMGVLPVMTDGTVVVGDGTSGTEITLGQQGASSGQFLAWNGTSWVPTTLTANGLETVTLLKDNNDGTFTYENENGVEVDINKASLTSNGDGTYTFSNGDGSDVTFDVNDNDSNSANELNTGVSLSGTTLNVTDAGGTLGTDLDTAFATDTEVSTIQTNLQNDIDQNESDADAAIALKEDAANKSNDITTDTGSTVKFPTVAAVEAAITASADGDGDSTNELNTAFAIVNNGTEDVLRITDVGGNLDVPVASLNTSTDDQDATEVNLNPSIDIDEDGTAETTVQQAITKLNDDLDNVFSPTYADYLGNATAQTLTVGGSEITLNLALGTLEDTGYTLAGNQVTIADAGLYEITYTVSVENTSNRRANATFWMEIVGNSPPEIAGSRGHIYSRNNNSKFGTVSVTRIVNLTANQVIQIKGEATGNPNGEFETRNSGTSLVFRRLR